VVRWAPALQRTAKGALRRVRGTSARSNRPSSIIKQQTRLRLLAADSARALRSASRPPRKEGAGKAGCRLAPARLPCKNDAHATHRSDTGQPKHPAFPAQWFDGLCALSPETNSVLPPSPPRNSRTSPRLRPRRLRKDLTVATTARTTRFCRTRQRRPSCAVGSVLTGFIPPCALHSASAPLASTAARSAVRDDVRPPLFAGSG
jgi:hypothetical protein